MLLYTTIMDYHNINIELRSMHSYSYHNIIAQKFDGKTLMNNQASQIV